MISNNGGNMKCPNCGVENKEDAWYCYECGHNLKEAGAEKPHSNNEFETGKAYVIPNHLASSILVTFFCCLPLGIVAIINAAQVNSRAANGDIAGAYKASDAAKKWSGAAFLIGLLWYGLLFLTSIVQLIGGC
jgi:uncharacterized membrane protein YvbJ